MIDLRQDLASTWRTMSRMPSQGGARTVMFLSSHRGVGVSSVAASFAALAANRSTRSVWLFDLDLMSNAQHRAFSGGQWRALMGALGPAHSAELGEASMYSLSSVDDQVAQNKQLLTVHRAGRSRLLVTRFRHEKLLPGQQVRVRTGAEYWRQLRGIADWVIIDAPPLEESGAGLAVCSQVDAVVPVIRADYTPAHVAARVKREIESHGGNCVGVVLNAMRPDARFVDQLTG